MVTKATQKFIKIGERPVVIIPIEVWENIKEKLEDLEILKSKFLRDKIRKARAEKKLYSSTEVKRILKIK